MNAYDWYGHTLQTALNEQPSLTLDFYSYGVLHTHGRACPIYVPMSRINTPLSECHLPAMMPEYSQTLVFKKWVLDRDRVNELNIT